MVDTLQQSKRRRYSRHGKATAGISRGSCSLEALWPHLMGGKGSPSLKSGEPAGTGLQTEPLGSQNLLLQNFPSEANQLLQLSWM